jgi:hypothetical protein
MYHAQIVDGQLLITGRQRTTFFQPADAALNHIAVSITPSIIADWSPAPPFTSFLTRWNDCSNAMGAQPVSDA